MKSSALLLWLALFAGDPNATPSALAGGAAFELTPSAWVGYWLVSGDRQVVSVVLSPVRGRDPWAARMTFRRQPTEEWVVRLAHGQLHLTRAGLGHGQLSEITTGTLVGRLTRGTEAGEVRLSHHQ